MYQNSDMPNPSEFGKRLRESRKENKLTQAAVAKRVGISQGTLSELEGGHHASSASTPALAHLYGVNALWLAEGRGPHRPGGHDPGRAFDVNVAPARIGDRRIPLINFVQAGQLTEIGAEFSGDAMEYLLTDLNLSEHAFALEIDGLSMTPEFSPGDRVIIDQEVAPSAGDFVVARNGKEEATFKKYRPRGISERGQDVFELVPLNDDYPTLYSDREPLQVIGTMVEHRRYRRR